MRVIREGTVKYLAENFGLSASTTEVMFDTGLLREDVSRRVLILDEYHRRARSGKKTELKWELAEKYAVSPSTVEKILCKSE
ncbi:MAG: hypothetical protein ABFS38_20005 [Bacteroidota bacterium]